MKAFLVKCTLALAGVAAVGAVQAQWAWVDNSGRKIYSDQAPPSNIPESQILKGPNGRAYKPRVVPKPAAAAPTYRYSGADGAAPEAVAPAPAQPATAAPVAAASAAKGAKTALEVAAEKKKREEQAAAEAKKKKDERARREADAKDCQRVRESLATIDSGMRIATTNANGERSIMDDSARATERKRLQEMASRVCR